MDAFLPPPSRLQKTKKAWNQWIVAGPQKTWETRRTRKRTLFVPARLGDDDDDGDQRLMPDYKFYYFVNRGRGEAIRQMFHLTGTKFTDEVLTQETWAPIKDGALF
ncbi:unnamed protein product, partial [Mesorhabditis spiculigera]